MNALRSLGGNGDGATRAELIDLLLELQHDLGKYLVMPLLFLPKEAGPEAIREALHKALFATREGPRGKRTARAIWEAFLDEGGAALRLARGLPQLSATVERALGWASHVDDPKLDRGQLEIELGAVAPAVRALIRELEDGA